MNDQGTGATLDPKTAEQLARLFNVAFNGALLYGGDHPTTKKGVEPFTSVLQTAIAHFGPISLVLDRESLFFEDVCLDKIINCKRIIAQFTKVGIISVTFDSGVTLADIQLFVKLSGDNRDGLTFDVVNGELQRLGCQGIRLNFVRYGKITNDQAIVGKDFGGSYSGSGQSDTLNEQYEQISRVTLGEIEKIASLSTLLEQPGRTASLLKSGMENPDTAAPTLNALTQLRQEISSSKPPSIDILLDAVYELKCDLSEALEAQKATGRILSMENQTTTPVDQLTVDVLVKLVRDEYSTGSLSLKRLSQIILRMLPDLNELKRVLPQLKNALLAQGMPLGEYCHLVNFLDADLESEMLSGSLTEAAEGIGVSVKEIVEAIKAQPSEAARLIYLAAEIRQGAHSDDTYLSNLLTDYIEKVTTDLALDHKEVGGPQGNQVLRSMLLQLEEQLVDKLKKFGVEGNVILNVKQQLTSRFEGLVAQASDQWLSNVIPDEGTGAGDALAKITSFFGKTFGADQTRDSLVNALQNKGYNQERIDSFFKKLTDQVSAGHTIQLPSNVLSPNNMLFLLNREIKQQIRYPIALSTLMITIHRIIAADQIRPPQQEESDILLVQMFRVIKKIIREIDLMGTLGPQFPDTIFVIMSMTDSAEAGTVAQRLYTVLGSRRFSIGSDSVIVRPAISVTNPVKDMTKDYKTYLELVRQNHEFVIQSL